MWNSGDVHGLRKTCRSELARFSPCTGNGKNWIWITRFAVYAVDACEELLVYKLVMECAKFNLEEETFVQTGQVR